MQILINGFNARTFHFLKNQFFLNPIRNAGSLIK